MRDTIAINQEKLDLKKIGWGIILGGIASFLPFVLHIQLITGVIVNAILILSLLTLGIRPTISVALTPSLMALAGGLLPTVLAPVVPFIMISNIIFILTIDYFQKDNWSFKKRYLVGVMAGATLKFLFLLSSVNVISKIITTESLVSKVAVMMSWPQLATALAGGVLAWGIYQGVWLKLKNRV